MPSTNGNMVGNDEDKLYGGTLFPYDDLTQKIYMYAQDPIYQRLVGGYLHDTVALEFMEMFYGGIMRPEELDERTLEFAKGLQPDHCRFVMNQFRKSNLLGVQQPVQYLGSLLKNFKERVKLLSGDVALATPVFYAPKKESLQALIDRTGYPLEVTIGQRKYGGPPPGYEGPTPGNGCEVYIGRIPKDVYEDELVPMFEQFGRLYDFRLMMDPVTGTSKGYAFATYFEKSHAAEAAKKLEDYEIKPGKKLRVNVSIANTRLFIGNIPKSKSKAEIIKELSSVSEIEGVRDVIIYADAEDPLNKKNCGYCFVEFLDHKSASTAKRRLTDGHVKPWNCNVVANWAEPQEEPDDATMAGVRTLFVKNLKGEISEDIMRKAFGLFGEVYKCRKNKDYAFIYYSERDSALKAIDKMHGKEFHGSIIDVSLAKPQSETRRKAMQSRMQRKSMEMGFDPTAAYYGAGGAGVDYSGYYGYPPAAYGAEAFDYSGYGYGYAPGGAAAAGMGRGATRGTGIRPMAGPAAVGMRARASATMAAQFRMRGAMGAAAAMGARGGLPVKRPFPGGSGDAASEAKRAAAATNSPYWGYGSVAGYPY